MRAPTKPVKRAAACGCYLRELERFSVRLPALAIKMRKGMQ